MQIRKLSHMQQDSTCNVTNLYRAPVSLCSILARRKVCWGGGIKEKLTAERSGAYMYVCHVPLSLLHPVPSTAVDR